MFVRVTYAGVFVGSTEFRPAVGLAHAWLVPAHGYAAAASPAQAMGRALAVTQYHSPSLGEFADAVAGWWTGGRLALEDAVGRELGVASVVLVERPSAGEDTGEVQVVADFRPASARVEAWMHPRRRSGSDGTPPTF